MDGHHNGEDKKDKKTNNDQQNITQKTKDRATRTTLKIRSYSINSLGIYIYNAEFACHSNFTTCKNVLIL